MADIAEVRSAVGPAPDAPRASREAWNADAGFYFAMALVSTTIILMGFAPSFYLKSLIHAPPPLSFLTVTHGVVFTAWMGLFVTQSGLIAAGRNAPHKQLGILGALLFGVMISLGYSTAITAGRLGHAPPGAPAPLAFMALPVLALAGATALVGAALWNRRRPDWHKRLMVSSIFVMTGPGSGRLAIPLGFADQGTAISLGLADLLLAVAIAYDFQRHKRVHPAYMLAASIFAVVNVGVFWAFGSPAWMSFARMITQTA
ncbi:MAG: hypothetical protein JO303_13935 [Caulobacteraceae bacterium]|nr:hypothetical protein [Caulobacteraceae bacterium]